MHRRTPSYESNSSRSSHHSSASGSPLRLFPYNPGSLLSAGDLSLDEISDILEPRDGPRK